MKDEGGRMKKAPGNSLTKDPTLSKSDFHPSSLVLHPSKRRFGQNFLVDKNIIDRVISAINPQSHETIVEIGPGRGALTSRLIEKAGRVIAIEFDRDLIPQLRDQFHGSANFQIVEADALTVNFCDVARPEQRLRVVANLPYNIATAILQRLIEQRHCLINMTLMLQREVVDRIMAEAGSTERGYLSVLVEAYCETEKVFDVSPRIRILDDGGSGGTARRRIDRAAHFAECLFEKYRDLEGLLRDVPNWVFSDWADIDKRGASTALNA